MNTQRPRRRATCPFSRRLPSKVVDLCKAVYDGLDTPVSRFLSGCLSRHDYRSVVDFSIRPEAYKNVSAFRRDYLAASLLSKFPGFDLGVDLEKEAEVAFLEREKVCRGVEVSLRDSLRVGSFISDRTLYSVLHTAREKIARLLGPFDWDQAEPHFGFGPGATYTLPHRCGDPYYKYRARPCTTYGCAILSYTALRRVPTWFNYVARLGGHGPDELLRYPILKQIESLFCLVPGNRVTFVPKSATKMRTIAIEPTMNGYIQHGLGKLLEKRLRRVGVDLHDQTKNQRLAREGSADGSLATLDLSAASDSITMELCKQLLPPDWFDAISQTRCEEGTLPDGTVVQYSKVSSMGNGYTFALESLLFWALCASCILHSGSSDRRLAVYGDDLIVPTATVPIIQWVLSACGFSLNPSKSFSDGPFRESCGKHFFLGTDVSPFYIREDVDTVPRLLWFANQSRRWSRAFWGLDPFLKPAYTLAVQQLPSRLRQPSIPDGFGDGGLIGDFDEVTPMWGPVSKGLAEGWRFHAWLPVIKTREFSDTPFLLRQLSQPSTNLVDSFVEQVRIARTGGWLGKSVRLVDDAFRVIPEVRTPQWRRVNGSTTDWPSYGPWL